MANEFTRIGEVPRVTRATRAAKPAKGKATRPPRLRKPTDPAGRVDILAIRLLEVAVTKYGDIHLRGIYGTYKTEIDRALRRHLGKFKLYIPPQLQAASQPGGRNAS